jgi:hypothetical protein
MNSVGVRARGSVQLHPHLLERPVALRRLQGARAVTTFSQIDSPPLDRGGWSSVSRPFDVPQ